MLPERPRKMWLVAAVPSGPPDRVDACPAGPVLAAAGRLRRGTPDPGSSADCVAWAQVIQRAYEDTDVNWTTHASFVTLATLIATVAIALDSQNLVIDAMVVLGPEFGVTSEPKVS